eukprot:CAMPEP_0116914932 /NCGR_PEP_ID=MMETSP0467-20121206/17623_1 /TAXON_ID=283647 /ORGANISM="Mesodinium pulex, Strain SPMC105" /LENGTH=48 /DNA_ID= /DNA_START= /DNA_END= /DNA_ORIENTATION=
MTNTSFNSLNMSMTLKDKDYPNQHQSQHYNNTQQINQSQSMANKIDKK